MKLYSEKNNITAYNCEHVVTYSYGCLTIDGAQSISSPVSPRVQSLVKVSERRGTLLLCGRGSVVGSVTLSFSLALQRSSRGDPPVWVR